MRPISSHRPPHHQVSEKPKAGTDATLNGGGQRYGNGTQPHPPQRGAFRRSGRGHSSLPAPALAPDASAQLRDRLLGELSVLARSEDAALWAKRCLPAKNQLSAADARGVETAFQAKLSGLAVEQVEERSVPKQTGIAAAGSSRHGGGSDGNRKPSIRVRLPYRSRAASATASMSDTSPSSPA